MVEIPALVCGQSTHIQDFKLEAGLKENLHICERKVRCDVKVHGLV